MGTPQLACASLQALLDSNRFLVIAVVTQPDRPKGRDLKLTPSPVKEFAMARGLSVLQPSRARDEQFIEAVRTLEPDLIIVTAYGQILPPALLEIPRFGCLNVHTSLLPKYRGAAPIQWSILNGDAETGITIMKMDAGLDTGEILSQERIPILNEDTSETLHARLADIGGQLLVKTIDRYIAGEIRPTPQPAEGSSYARKIVKEDGKIDWNRPAQVILNQIRGLTPWPGAFTHLPLPHPELLKISRAEIYEASAQPGEVIKAAKDGIVVACGKQAIRILALQREGGRRLSAEQFLAGRHLRPGERLGEQG